MDSFAGMYRGASSFRKVSGPRMLPWDRMISTLCGNSPSVYHLRLSYQAETHQEDGIHGDFLCVAALVRC